MHTIAHKYALIKNPVTSSQASANTHTKMTANILKVKQVNQQRRTDNVRTHLPLIPFSLQLLSHLSSTPLHLFLPLSNSFLIYLSYSCAPFCLELAFIIASSPFFPPLFFPFLCHCELKLSVEPEADITQPQCCFNLTRKKNTDARSHLGGRYNAQSLATALFPYLLVSCSFAAPHPQMSFISSPTSI